MSFRTISIIGGGTRKEGATSGTIVPGDLVELTSADLDTVKAQATAAADCQRAFAVENDLAGKTIDDAYVATVDVVPQCLYGIFQRGDEVYARLATSNAITKGGALESAGGGLLRAHNAGKILAFARESVTTTSAIKRIRIEVA